MVKESGTRALADAGIEFDQIEEAFAGYVYGDSSAGERAIYELGMTGIPIANVNNNCSTGSTALFLADCALAIRFENMQKYGSTPEHCAKIAEKNHRHSKNDPYAQLQDEYTLAQIQQAKMIYEPIGLTRLQCSPTSDGSGAAIVVSKEFVEKQRGVCRETRTGRPGR